MQKEKDVRCSIYTIGNIVKGMATLVDDDYNLIQIPLHLLPQGAQTKSMVKITIERDENAQKKRDQQIQKIHLRRLKNGLPNTVINNQ